jgi:hypothetical protein
LDASVQLMIGVVAVCDVVLWMMICDDLEMTGVSSCRRGRD